MALNSFIRLDCRTVSLLSLEAFSPLNQTQWTQHLTSYPDKEFSAYILAGIKSGFRIGFDRAQPLHSATTNLHSNNPSVISEYLSRDVSLNRMWKYPRHSSPPGIHISPMGAIPKKNKPGKWHLIVDLSSPKGFSINDGISPELSSLSYVSLDHLASIVTSVGRVLFSESCLPKQIYILWWYLFATDWNVISMLWDIGKLLPEFNVVSDASGTWGCGAYWDEKWFHFQWPSILQSLNIAIKELIPVVVAATSFGNQWQGKLIQFTVDNMAVVHVLNSTYSKDPHLMHLIRILVFIAARCDFWFVAKHIEGQANTIADDLSRNNMVHFFSQVPQARLYAPPPIPDALVDLLGSQHLDWTSTGWINLFGSTMNQVCPPQPTRLMKQPNANT